MTTTTFSAPPPVPAALSIARGDFPSWLPATLVKELRQGLRTRGFVGTFIGFQILMAMLMMSVAAQSLTTNAAMRAGSFNTANGFFWTILTLQLLVFTPARALGSLQLEVTSRTIDLLMLTRLDAWRIVTGKWASLVAQSMLLLIAMLPYGIVRYFAGSVDLVSDAIQCAALLGGSALLTAAGLWGAGMGKIFRIVGIVMAVMFSGAGSSLFAAFTRPGSPLASFGGMKGASAGLLWFDAGLLLVFFLVAAVRNIAPRGENHALLARVLPLCALVPVPIAVALAGASTAITAQLVAAGFFLLLVGATELASLEMPMLVHFRAAKKRAALPRVFLRMMLPGWPSAFLYVVFAATVWLACAALSGVAGGAGAAMSLGLARSIWLAVLALAGLVFPALLLSMLPRAPRAAGGMYLVIVAVAGALVPLGYAFASMSPRLEWVKALGVVPVASFFATLADDAIGSAEIVAQAACAAAVIGMAWWRARGYWQYLSLLEARERKASP